MCQTDFGRHSCKAARPQLIAAMIDSLAETDPKKHTRSYEDFLAAMPAFHLAFSKPVLCPDEGLVVGHCSEGG